VNQTLTGKLQHGFFEGTDEVHLTQHGLKKMRVRIAPILRGGAKLDPRFLRGKLNSLGHL
jgi:hypothetical protein